MDTYWTPRESGEKGLTLGRRKRHKLDEKWNDTNPKSVNKKITKISNFDKK